MADNEKRCQMFGSNKYWTLYTPAWPWTKDVASSRRNARVEASMIRSKCYGVLRWGGIWSYFDSDVDMVGWDFIRQHRLL